MLVKADRHHGVRDPGQVRGKALEECGQKGIAGAVLIPSGFAETGNQAMQDELVAKVGECGSRHLPADSAIRPRKFAW
jgi:hypothetical protein